MKRRKGIRQFLITCEVYDHKIPMVHENMFGLFNLCVTFLTLQSHMYRKINFVAIQKKYIYIILVIELISM